MKYFPPLIICLFLINCNIEDEGEDGFEVNNRTTAQTTNNQTNNQTTNNQTTNNRTTNNRTTNNQTTNNQTTNNQTTNNQTINPVYAWQVRSLWTCKGGTKQTRSVECREQHSGDFVVDGFCDSKTKPDSSFVGKCSGGVIDTPNSIEWSGEGYRTEAERKWMSKDVDIKITSIRFKTEWLKGAIADYAFFAFRDRTPEYSAYSGGYSELFDVNINQYGTDNKWQKKFDFVDTPLYIPAKTKFACTGSGGSFAKNLGFRSCKITYESYYSGEDRFRVLRLPYLDAAYKNESYKTNAFKAPLGGVLKVKGFYLYDAVNNGSYTACLRWLNSDGSLKEESCLARNKTLTSDNLPPDFIPLNWAISGGETLSSRCDARNPQSFFDCAFFTFVEIPPNIEPGPENIFRDYGNIIPPDLTAWCEDYIDNTILASQALQLCQYRRACVADKSQLKTQCKNTYSAASCMATSSCFDFIAPQGCTYRGGSVPHSQTRWFYKRSSVSVNDQCDNYRAILHCEQGVWKDAQVFENGKWVSVPASDYPHETCS